MTAYARVSSHDQKDIRSRCWRFMRPACGWAFEAIADLGFGMNHCKKCLKQLRAAVTGGEAGSF